MASTGLKAVGLSHCAQQLILTVSSSALTAQLAFSSASLQIVQTVSDTQCNVWSNAACVTAGTKMCKHSYCGILAAGVSTNEQIWLADGD